MKGPGFVEDFKDDNGRHAHLGERSARRGLDFFDCVIIVMCGTLGAMVLYTLTALLTTPTF